MRNIAALAAAVAVAATFAASGCSIIRAAPTPTASTGTMQGVITGPGGPIAGASIIVTTSDATQHAAQSDSGGYYSIAALPVGPASYVVRANGYAAAQGNIVIVADPGPNRQDVSLNPQ